MSGGWSRVARRIRVPIGFLFAAAFLWLAQPRWWSIIAGAAIVLPALALRALASGHVRKDRELTTSGPYAYTRNPLYLGSVMLAAGFALASRNLWIALAIGLLFVVIYLPTVHFEEQYLRATFPEFAGYEQQVPRFIPRIKSLWPGTGFLLELYLQHREYQAALGALAMLAALIIKLLWFNQ